MVKNIRRTGVLGKQTLQRDMERLRAGMTNSGGAGGGSDHGTLIGLNDDDHSQYVHVSAARTITAQHSFSPGSPQAPFLLGANAQGQLVTGLNADELDGSHWVSIASDLIPTTVDTYDLGSSAKLWRKGYLSELEALLFVENSIHVEGGWLIVGHDQGTLDEDVNNSQTTIDFGKAMTLNDFVLMRAFLQVEYVKVGTLVSGTEYNVARDEDGTGANTWPQGTVFLVLGNTGDGRIELVANQTDAPRISILEQGATYNASTERVRIGNLRGSYGVGSNDYYGVGVGDYSGGNYLRYNDTNGFLMKVGDGNVALNAGGIGITSGASVATSRSYRFTETTELGLTGAMYGWQTGGEHAIEIVTESITGENSVLTLGTKYPTGANSNIYMSLQEGAGIVCELFLNEGRLYTGTFVGASPDFRVSGSMQVRTSNYTDWSVPNGHLYVEGDIRVGGGLSVGSTATNPASGHLIVTDKIFINHTVNDEQTHGLTIFSDATLGYTGNEFITLEAPNITHAITDITKTDTFFRVGALETSAGGAFIDGFTDATGPSRGLMLIGTAYTAATGTSRASIGSIMIRGNQKSGTTVGAMSGTATNLLVVDTNGTARLIIKGGGGTWLDTSVTSGGVGAAALREYGTDNYEDIKLLEGLRGLLLPPELSLQRGFKEFIDYARPVLEAHDIIRVNDGLYGNDDDGSIFMHVQNIIMLTVDTIRQMHERILQLEARNESNN